MRISLDFAFHIVPFVLVATACHPEAEGVPPHHDAIVRLVVAESLCHASVAVIQCRRTRTSPRRLLSPKRGEDPVVSAPCTRTR